MHQPYVEIGCAPTEVKGAQATDKDYAWRAWHECRAFLGQLRRTFGPEPPGCHLYIREIVDQAGARQSVCCSFGDRDKVGEAFAWRCHAERPSQWDADARAFLGLDAPAAAKPKRKGRGARKAVTP